MVMKLWRSIAGGIVCTALGISSPALADEEYPEAAAHRGTKLAPLGSWNLDYGAEQCRLARLFGSDDDQHLLSITQAWPGNTFSLTVAGSSFRPYRSGGSAHIGIRKDMPLVKFELPLVGTMDEFGFALVLSRVSVHTSQQLDGAELNVGDDEESTQRRIYAGLAPSDGSQIDRIVFRRGRKIVSFETGNLKAAFEALNTCTANLLGAWGLDPIKHQSFVPAVWLNEEEVVQSIVAQYPSSARRRGEQAVFDMRVIIDEKGAVTECRMNAATVVEDLKSPACKAMQEAKFSPALDEQDEPMPSFYATKVTYQLNE